MKTIKVADLMVPLSEYATVPDDASLYDAVMALEKSQEKYTYTHSQYRHRAILVLDKSKKVIGKISQLDVLRALEPKYGEILEGRGFQGVGFSKKFLKSMLKDYALVRQRTSRSVPQGCGKTCYEIHAHPRRGRIRLRGDHVGSGHSPAHHRPSPVAAGNPRGRHHRHHAADGRVCGPLSHDEGVSAGVSRFCGLMK